MKIVFLALGAMLLVTSACGRDQQAPSVATSAATFTTAGTAQEQYRADYADFIRSSYKAEYETKGTYSDPDEKHMVTWFKESNERFRYDFDGHWTDIDLQLEGLTVILGPAEYITICSSDDNIREGGGCCDQSCAEGAGNFVYYLAFPLGLPDPEDIDVDIDVLEVAMEQVAGYDARCYVFSEASDSRTRVCYTADGIQVAYSYEDSGGGTSRTIQSLGTVAGRDFDLPYPLITPTAE
jgi:hypothetical protein